MPVYEVIVGNVGTVYHGSSEAEATRLFENYREVVKNPENWWTGGESVVMFEDGEIVREIQSTFDIDGESGN